MNRFWHVSAVLRNTQNLNHKPTFEFICKNSSNCKFVHKNIRIIIWKFFLILSIHIWMFIEDDVAGHGDEVQRGVNATSSSTGKFFVQCAISPARSVPEKWEISRIGEENRMGDESSLWEIEKKMKGFRREDLIEIKLTGSMIFVSFGCREIRGKKEE